MVKIGITGGIGSGKSYVCKRLAELYNIEVYDCDTEAKMLMRTSPEIKHKLTELIGPDVYVNGEINKPLLTQYLLESEYNANTINYIVHPVVFRDFEESGKICMESAILYESGANWLVDKVIVVSAPEDVRIRRIMERDNITREKSLQWMQRQWPQEDIIKRADYEIINDGKADIDSQLQIIFKQLKNN